jgi:light-regulated signal transduction histidine kinase (bacteriophytochrome)
VSLDQLVKEILIEMQPETISREIVWKIGTLRLCYGDRSMLRLVFVNLISNAIKFTRQRERAEIEIGCAGENTDEVVVFVKDSRPLLKIPTFEEKRVIEAALAEAQGQVSGPTGAAARLGIPASTLDSKIKALKIDKQRYRSL